MNLLETRRWMKSPCSYAINVCLDGRGEPIEGGGIGEGNNGTILYNGSGGTYSVEIFEHVQGTGDNAKAKVTFTNQSTGSKSHFALTGSHNFARSPECPGIYVKHGGREINPAIRLKSPNDPFPSTESEYTQDSMFT